MNRASFVTLIAVLLPLEGFAQVVPTATPPPAGHSAAVFRVGDFGAVGDGKTDDAPAVRRALAAAIQAGAGSKVTFERKSYRFARQPGDAILVLNGAAGITLEGNGAEIIGNPWNGFLSIRGCRDVSIRGFVLDCDPPSFTQGDIVEAHPGKGSLLLKIHEGYANPVELGETLGKKAWDRVGFTIDSRERRLKEGPIDFIESITEVNRPGRLLRIDLQADRFSHIVKGDRFVMGLVHGGSGALIEVNKSADIRLEDYTIHGGKFGMNHVFTDNDGRVHVKGAKITFRPGSGQLVTSIKDGFHVKHNGLGPVIEDCTLEGMMDDSINISVCPYWVKKDLGGNRYLIAELQFSPQVGDRLMAYTPVPGTVTRPLNVLAVEPHAPPGKPRGKWQIVTLDQAIPALSLHQGGDLFPGGEDKLRVTGLYNLDRCGQGYIVRNNTFLAQRRHALLARCPGGRFEGNTVDGIGGSGVRLGNETGSFYEGPFPEDTVIRGNTFLNCGARPIHLHISRHSAWARNITIENNRFSGWPDAAIHLSSLQGGVIRGNVIEASRAGTAGAVPVAVIRGGGIHIEGNKIHDESARITAGIDLSEGVEADTLRMSGNEITLAAGFPRLMSIVPAPSIQPRRQAIRPLRADEDTGASLQAGSGAPPGRKSGPVWTLHPPWKNGIKGALVFKVAADLTTTTGIRFATRSATGKGDGVALTMEWKPLNAADKDYRTCFKGTILSQEWQSHQARIDSQEGPVHLRFRLDCGPANDTGFDSVQLANLDVVSGKDGILRVKDFGAVGDGIRDDGPAIRKAFAAATTDGIPSTVIFEKKTYRLGNNPEAWHYFQMTGHEDLVIEGNGATLLCGESNLTFHFDGGRDITVRGLAFDTVRPAFTQGEVVAVGADDTLDVKIMDGYPEPPDEVFLTANKHSAHGGGGRHMIVFEQGGKSRNTRMRSDHLYIRNITRVSPGVFRFHVKEDYVPRMKGMAAGNWISYGFNKADLTSSSVALKNKSASIYGQIAADRVENITFENLDFFGSMNGGIRVSDMPGDVTLRKVRAFRKPGTSHLLSTISDALHLMNIRGKLLIENCEIEAPGDDCLNVGTLMERIVEISSDDPKAMALRTTDNHYYHYTIREGDKLQFLDTKAKREVGVATVTRAEFDPGSRIHRVVLDRELPGLDPAVVLALNLEQMTSSTVIRNNVMKPFMRNAMLVRAQNMIIDGNQLVGAHGGVLGLNFNHSMGESARLRKLLITGNTISGFEGSAIIATNPFRDPQGILDARYLSITDNLFHVGPARSIRISGFKGLEMRGNRFVENDQERADYSPFLNITDCQDVLTAP